MSAIPLEHEDDFYPSSDGKPMAESDLHRHEMVYLIEALQGWYEDVSDVYVAGNLFLYYVEGDPKRVVAPDVFVVKGVRKGNREIFKLWEEGRGPCFVIEVTSRSTRSEDLKTKWSLYERLGVEEYFLHDPRSEYLQPALQGHRLVGGKYQKIAPDADGSLISQATGLRLRREGEHLRLIDPATGRFLPSIEDYRRESRRKDEELRRKDAEIARLRRELESRRS